MIDENPRSPRARDRGHPLVDEILLEIEATGRFLSFNVSNEMMVSRR